MLNDEVKKQEGKKGNRFCWKQGFGCSLSSGLIPIHRYIVWDRRSEYRHMELGIEAWGQDKKTQE
jgi:hypothetical protein